MKKNTITKEKIDQIMASADFDAAVAHEKCVVVMCKLENGFVITESSACVDPANFDLETGLVICKKRIEDKLWELEGYALQKELWEKSQKKAKKAKKAEA